MANDVKQTTLLGLEERQQLLQEKLNRLQTQHDLETRVEEEMRIEGEIAEVQGELESVGAKLSVMNQRTLSAEANRLKRIGSTHEALAIWREILLDYPENTSATTEIASLEKLANQQDKAAYLIKRLATRIPDIRAIFKDVVAALRLPTDTADYQILLDQTESLLEKELDAEDYSLWWEVVSIGPKANTTESVDMARIAGRVHRGEMVLFLGSGIASVYGDRSAEEKLWVRDLAKQIDFEQFQGSLPSIAEYYQLKPDFGHSELLKILRGHLEQDINEVLFYLALAKLTMPLILISSVYDNSLEKAFFAAKKPFVELASIVRRSDDYDIGHVVVSYSDNSHPKKVYPEEELSGLRFIEEGYSVIYKIRGNFKEPDHDSVDDEFLQQDALTLSESSYFSFARYADRIIPSYLARQLRNRGFLFIGYQPKDWQHRLLASALLDKRHSREPCYVIGETPGPLEAAFWKSRSIEQCSMDVRELDRHLGEIS